jgi:hypothetical protein
MNAMDTTAATVKASRVAALHDRFNQARGGRAWTGVDLVLGFAS